MTPKSPLSRPLSVDRLPASGRTVVVEASAEEREALARDFGIPAIHGLVGRLKITDDLSRVHVRGTVEATVTQTCVVTLEPFESTIAEEVDLEFTEETRVPAGQEALREIDPPDEIVNGRIDLGAVTAEFLALGLDPYPRKPGAAFDPEPGSTDPEHPFAALQRLADKT